jgi:hypothetical protein
MPAKLRAAKDRRPVFTAEVIALFLEIERTPGGHMPYTRQSRRLAELLHLTTEWCSSCHVNDVSTWSHYPAGHLTDIAFWKVREVRNALLAVAAGELAEPLDADEKVPNIRHPGASAA